MFRREVFDPENAVTIFQERFDQKNIGLIFSNQLARVVKTVGAPANMKSLVASDDCGHPLFAHTSVSHDHDPAWLFFRMFLRGDFSILSDNRDAVLPKPRKSVMSGSAYFYVGLNLACIALSSSMNAVRFIGADTTYLYAIGLFGFLVTLGLFIYELRGIQHCKALNQLASRLEGQLHLHDAQFTARPKARLGGFVGAEGAAYIIYPTMLVAWMFVIFIGLRQPAETSPTSKPGEQTAQKHQ